MVTDVLSSRNLLYHSKEANAHEGKCFCVVAVLFAYFGIFALTFLKYLTRLYASQNHCCRSSQCINTGNISGKFFLLKSFFGLNILTLQHSLQIKNRGKLNKINAFSSFWQQNVFTEIQICKLEVHIIPAILIRDVFRTQLSIYDEAF